MCLPEYSRFLSLCQEIYWAPWPLPAVLAGVDLELPGIGVGVAFPTQSLTAAFAAHSAIGEADAWSPDPASNIRVSFLG